MFLINSSIVTIMLIIVLYNNQQFKNQDQSLTE